MVSLKSLLKQAPSFAYQSIQNEGMTGLQRIGMTGYSHARCSISNPGKPIWTRDWDVLLILDACRVDLMNEIANEYEFVGDIETHTSVASQSKDWIARTFTKQHRKEIERTAYVTGNAFTNKVDLEIKPNVLDEVWKHAWNSELATIEARPITDRAITIWRETDVNQMIVHYMQPHVPFVTHPELGSYGRPEDFGEGFATLWHLIGETYDLDVVWKAYRDNLRYVMDDIELLLENLDAETVAISADHGNAVGEWGIYGHPRDILLRCIREVPWIVTDAIDTKSYVPNTERRNISIDSETVDSRLRDLGYL